MASMLAPVPKPASRLARYRALSPHASIHVSPLQLGGMSIGDKWEQFGLGSMTKESSFKLLDAFYEAGGNFIDTANNYQDQTSEQFIGEWAELRGIRDQLVIATKYSSNYMRGNDKVRQKVLYTGNSIKSMHVSLEASLKNLRTTYVDIFYLHWWDWETSIEEVMNGLHTLVQQGKVLYLGVSDTPAWIVSQANQYARDHGKTPFVIYQGLWNVMDRSIEREIVPMCKAHGMALAPWSVLAGGRLRSDEEEERRAQSGDIGRSPPNFGYPEWRRNEKERIMSTALARVARQVGAKHVTAVAIAYVMQKAPYVFPIIGGRKVEQFEANVEALEIVLSPEHIQYLESILPFDPGFPVALFGDGSEYNFLWRSAAYMEKQPGLRAIVPDES
ncbi:NADP-dependent oxidoreductase domain-containing protein [Boletus edulis]|uniref:NADP-dependent oxidoreductase domain-containing protein n=1 Tax=Boletus edulis BED1 TaxID=1328754 RepID=A0AAD4GGL7_BOLED|nr:NADP-dependent oxidoreductase domain-containing protein [Boletus edulis]KAF8443103.1 NADP-dependent oxidoreductase domain-containing protein [Boletus edulis BED1]